MATPLSFSEFYLVSTGDSVPFCHLQIESSPGLIAHRTENLKETEMGLAEQQGLPMEASLKGLSTIFWSVFGF